MCSIKEFQPWKSGIQALFVFGLFVNTCDICFVDLTPVPAAFVIEDHAEIMVHLIFSLSQYHVQYMNYPKRKNIEHKRTVLGPEIQI